MNRETEGLLYPDIDDTRFLSKLLRKREFRETQQSKITDDTLKNNVCEVQEFEYTSTQRFVAQFMSAKTPYNGMLLYHGVGVGKTCTAVLTAEAFLQISPKNKVYILAPPAIQAGFYRTIFDINRVTFGKDADAPNQHEGCTGNLYIELTQTQHEREKKDIELRVNRLIHKRYSIMGYVAFRNMVREILNQIPSTLSAEKKRQQEVRLLQKAFGGCLFIVDEAHNLRDVGDVDDDADQVDDAGGLDERGDAAGGKKLTPYLRKVLRTCEGNKLLLMTATPMYNTYKEIVSLLNLLLHVDHIDESELLKESDIEFHMVQVGDEMLEQLTPASEAKLVRIANSHVSFMRGENPKAFPARLDPPDAVRITRWADFAPNGTTKIEPEIQKANVLRLPLVKCELVGDSLTVMKAMTEKLVADKGVGIRTIDTLLQAGNCIYPGEGLDGRTGTDGFQSWFTAKAVAATFERTRISTLAQYVPAKLDPATDYGWMVIGRHALGKHSPKLNQVLQTIKNASGISFVYSRFVENGAVLFCLLLEANGYTPWGRSAAMFKGPIPRGRQCSKCEKKEGLHKPFDVAQPVSRENHKFSPAYYALLTASDVNTADKQSIPLSPNNNHVISVARDVENSDGSKIKVIVGSQVAGEGLDLRAIREVHILEGWFHLSKEEQIVGRGIRYCSHQALNYKDRNCTIYLYANTFPAEINKETIDQYSYRSAMNKAVRVGNVSRALKQGAADCNISREAILVSGLKEVEMTDSQRVTRTVDLNDKSYTPTCDWIRCSYQCKPTVDIKALPEDNSTYDIFAARFAEQSMITRLKQLFKTQVWFQWENIQEIFKDIPKTTLTSLLLRTVNNPSIVFQNGDMQGHLIYRNNFFIFQPNSIQDQAIPLALRYGRYPVKRDSYQPSVLTGPLAPTIFQKAQEKKKVIKKSVKVKETIEPTEEGAEEEVIEQEAVVPAPAEAPPAIKPSIDKAREFWTQANRWIDAWAKDDATAESIVENIPDTATNKLSTAILDYVENDAAKRENIETRLKKLQWWGKTIASVEGGLAHLRLVGRQLVWDDFLKGPEQIALLQEEAAYTDEAAKEQSIESGSIKAFRYLDIVSREVVYVCLNEGEAILPCAPSVIKLFTDSKTDPVVTAKAHQRVAAEIYGFMVPWNNNVMFKTNEPKPEGKDPGGGAACEIVSNVKGHRMKLIELGQILARYSGGEKFDLVEETLTGRRKLTGAPSFCALMEIVMRWMDVRKESYGGLRYFYRPLSSYYSKHKGKK